MVIIIVIIIAQDIVVNNFAGSNIQKDKKYFLITGFPAGIYEGAKLPRTITKGA